MGERTNVSVFYSIVACGNPHLDVLVTMSHNVSSTNVMPNSYDFLKFVFGVIGFGCLLSCFIPLHIIWYLESRKYSCFVINL